MTTNEKKLNRDLIIGWSIVVMILFVTYVIEVFKGERTALYVAAFTLISGVPATFCVWLYRKNPFSKQLRYYIVLGYFFMYVFAMYSGSTMLVFTYILPLLSMIILYHQPKLIFYTGAATLAINLLFISIRLYNHTITISNSKEVEIQIALLVLCFAGCYVGAVLYDEINRKNDEYVKELDEKSKQIQRMTLQTIETIANTIDAKDEYTKGHSRRVAEYAAQIATKLNMTEEEILNIRYIALLHDIGKIGIPDSVLNKPFSLTEAEFELMKKHTTIGGEILKDIGMLPDLAIGAKYHHERYDGKGYPNGIKGEEIPKIARIICVADAYDAMTSNRVYRKSLTKEIVLEELEKCKGTQFDPEITEVFLEYLEQATEWYIDDSKEESNSLVEASGKLLQRIVEDKNKQAQKDTEEDELTGVYNRSTGERKITIAMRDGIGSLILVNIDNMRQINGEYGFRKGDFCIKYLAERLKELSTDVIVSRFGGDEFLCYIPNVSKVEQLQEMMDTFIKKIQFSTENREVNIPFTVSIGISIQENNDTKLHQYLMEADKALYHVKQEEKNGYYFYRQLTKEISPSTKIDWNNIMESIHKGKASGGSDMVAPSDLIRIYDVVAGAARASKPKNVRLVMFTAKMKQEDRMSIEQREEIMRLMEYAILNTLKNEGAVSKYSSVQRIVMISGENEEAIHKTLEAILANFYKIYDKKDVELYYDIANVNEKLAP